MHKEKKHDEIKQNKTKDAAEEEKNIKNDNVSEPENNGDNGVRLEEKIADLEAEVSSLKDQYLRKLADYENFRKRMFREKEDAVKYANSQIMTDLISVIDDFDRAIFSSELSRDFTALHDGIEMIRKGLVGMLSGKYGLEAMNALGSDFDPNMHEAVMTEQGECKNPVVTEEFIKGYKLRDRVLRSAKVKVCMPLPAGADEKDEPVKADA
ncbi:nucleotide exchange factor GrpE [Spirochaetota bacterium]